MKPKIQPVLSKKRSKATRFFSERRKYYFLLNLWEGYNFLMVQTSILIYTKEFGNLIFFVKGRHLQNASCSKNPVGNLCFNIPGESIVPFIPPQLVLLAS